MRCVVSYGSTSFPWFVFFFGALLWGSLIHKHTQRWLQRWLWQGNASIVSWNWEKYSFHLPYSESRARYNLTEPIPLQVEQVAVEFVVEPPQSCRSWTCFQENEWLRSVDSPLRLCQLVCRRLTTNLSAVRPKLNDVLSSSFLTVLCVLNIYFSLFRKSSTYLIGWSYQTNS